MMAKNGAEKLAWIEERLATGATIIIGSYTKPIQITPANYKRWKSKGQTMFRVGQDNSLYIARGKNWDCIDYSPLKAFA